MQYTQNLRNVESELSKLLESNPFILRTIRKITDARGVAYLVGGAVRDLVCGKLIHDLDIEVHGLSLDTLSGILSHEGPVSYVGKSFGVLKLHGTHTDWSLPRSDTSGRKPHVFINPDLGIEEALIRRDLTMNAMAINLSTGEFVDPFHGLRDLQDNLLRSPHIDFFCEDPLRFYRVMQFISRFEMYPDKVLFERCKVMDIRKVSVERIEYECEKLLLKSRRPSLGFRWLHELGRLEEIFPELGRMLHVPQDTIWHPEGTVLEHLFQALDAAAQIDKENEQLNLILRYAALCHDLGKSVTTKIVDGHIISHGHAEAGVPLTQAFLERITRNEKVINTVRALVKNHMQPFQLVQQDSSVAAYKRLAIRLAPLTTSDMLYSLSLADSRGRNPKSPEPLAHMPAFAPIFLARAQEAQSLYHAEKPLLQGADLIDLVKPGPEMGILLKYAYDIQIEKSISDKDLLYDLIKEYLKK